MHMYLTRVSLNTEFLDTGFPIPEIKVDSGVFVYIVWKSEGHVNDTIRKAQAHNLVEK